MIKDFFKLYLFLLAIIFGFLLCLASTFGVFVITIILCVTFKTGTWLWLLTILLFTVPFWYCVVLLIKGEI